ncbi:type II toxin-antitoxin system Phd/YefM family antitoxin [Propionimicrobium sp. PCR01-08-3]|uniref:type II toxin-antitoxin system Phd/YefM family antitoxin n=1 Tax=Propionimicrobium sp. PCR01-08-3 TaxID=3052086 RepID=UPI00255CD582|nr:type II toxin-antitoxin system Phd/YefM family antitoxin [Propionimicrobium sp. PCR01-08-3]WIY83701.1 type II toxin-antitoxin system Phd/YefM family antitoxin [Propionimicrobium sp. PCR01-08-3]
MTTISATVARQTLPAQLDLVEAGEEVSITRHGRVVAVLVSPEFASRHRAREAWKQADQIGEMLAQARTRPIGDASISPERAEELVQGIYADRAAAE